MLRAASAFVALTFATALPQPVAGQCYGPECNRYRSAPPAQFDDRSYQHPGAPNGARTYAPAPHQQGGYAQPPHGHPHVQHAPQGYRHAQPGFHPGQQNHRHPHIQQGQPHVQHPRHNFHHHAQPGIPQPGYQQPVYQQPGYQQPGYQPPTGYSGRPASVPPQGYHPPGYQVRQTGRPVNRQPSPHVSRKVGRQVHDKAAQQGPAPARAGTVTISVVEYRDLQNQARELQRLRSGKAGTPDRRAVFPDVPVPPAAAKPTL